MRRCFPEDDSDPLFTAYHDNEWGKLNLDESHLYEMMILQLFQSGLSWRLVIHKRESFRRAFVDFDVAKVAHFTDDDCERLLHDATIIRNRRKINAAIHNAKVLNTMHQNGHTLANELTNWIPQPIIHHPKSFADIPNSDSLSIKIAKKFHNLGFKLMGPVTTYSFLQSVGLINDHLENCDFKY